MAEYKADEFFNHTKKGGMTIEKAIALLMEKYEADKRNEHIHNPVAHALYKTWREADRECPRYDADLLRDCGMEE